uniref:Ig-like domain-containing protein n=1 Tax=Electrophorus electricus TaxID=8005 RepID=A0A4W4EQB0_ELEEL
IKCIMNCVMSFLSSVSLPSGADPTWKLVNIRWSIYTNDTFIATFRKGEFLNKYWKYKDRLVLNTITGHLEIKDLKADDGLRYTVLLKSRDLAFLSEKLRTPSIHIISRSLKDGFCAISLSCTSEDNVTLFWKPESGFMLWTSFSPNRNITFYCTATDGDLKELKKHNLKCQVFVYLLACYCTILNMTLYRMHLIVYPTPYSFSVEIWSKLKNCWDTVYTKS